MTAAVAATIGDASKPKQSFHARPPAVGPPPVTLGPELGASTLQPPVRLVERVTHPVPDSSLASSPLGYLTRTLPSIAVVMGVAAVAAKQTLTKATEPAITNTADAAFASIQLGYPPP
eukprot:CAMPEP_0171652624 /NCGR_PEP_ID=MMETSP0990-20121206/39079_1 /TAXON_ID=483369 /ORGANISM="non described non described, Strain CCMP2098" /LENGTH=117 /DNA_ID=CAMNT_0012231907 /DNA_START=218 /DNA_END=570 /DNA_ORIENTATION=+